jgi:hypothetical protein
MCSCSKIKQKVSTNKVDETKQQKTKQTNKKKRKKKQPNKKQQFFFILHNGMVLTAPAQQMAPSHTQN